MSAGPAAGVGVVGMGRTAAGKRRRPPMRTGTTNQEQLPSGPDNNNFIKKKTIFPLYLEKAYIDLYYLRPIVDLFVVRLDLC